MIPIMAPTCGFSLPGLAFSEAVAPTEAPSVLVPSSVTPVGIILQYVYKTATSTGGYPAASASLSTGFTQIRYRTTTSRSYVNETNYYTRNEFIIGYRMLDPSLVGTSITGNNSTSMTYCIITSTRSFQVSIALAANGAINTSSLSGNHIIVGGGSPSGDYDTNANSLAYDILDGPGGTYSGKVVGALAVT